MEKLKQLPDLLLPWYAANRRDLPWRQDRDPYHIWLSEIMLQQTRVEAVKGYYTRFLAANPTVAELAACEDDRLHKLWEGLGYYSRVKNLKKAAKEIMSTYGGEFPEAYEKILALPGIGAYTAGAICSIAFSQPRAAVDGNVLRVLSRLRSDPECIDSPKCKTRVARELEAVYPREDPGSFTQALMELGATVCLPGGAPKCGGCPLRDLCGGQWQSYPVRAEKRKRALEEKTVFILERDGLYALRRRPEQGLLAGLWEFPHISGLLEPEQAIDHLEQQGLRPRELEKMVTKSHIFTHIRWDMRGYYISVREPGGFTWMSPEQLRREAALPTAFRQFWEDHDYV